LGSSIAIHLATFHANKVKSLFLISPLSAYEPEEVASGRKEIWEVWKEGKEVCIFLSPSSLSFESGRSGTDRADQRLSLRTEQNQDDEVIKQACIGALQLGFNNAHSCVIRFFMPRSGDELSLNTILLLFFHYA
jgi:hypothetical protein